MLSSLLYVEMILIKLFIFRELTFPRMLLPPMSGWKCWRFKPGVREKLRLMDLEWLRDTVVDPAKWDQVY